MYKIKVQLGASFEPLILSFTTRVYPSGLLISAPPNCLPRGHREVRQELLNPGAWSAEGSGGGVW